MATSNKTIAKNTMFLYIRMAIVMVVTFYTSRVILQVLGASDYGIYNVVGGIVTMMAFLNSALGSSSSRFLTYELGTGNMDQLKKTFSASLNLHIAVSVLVLIVGETVGLWFFYEKLVIPEERMNAAFWVYQISIFTTMVSFTQVPFNASLIAHENMSVYAYVGLYEAISKLLIVYLLLISPFDHLIVYAVLLMLNSFGVQMFYRFYTRRKYEECRFRWVKDKELYKKLSNYSGWDLFGNCAVICQNQGINILLNLFFGPVVNAARAITFQIQGALNQFVNNFLTAVRPQVVKSFAVKDYDRMYGLTFTAAKYSYLLMLALMLPLCFEIRFVLKIWLGDNIPDYTFEFSTIVMITYLMETFHSASLMSYHAIGRIKTGNIIGGSMMILALPVSYLCLRFDLPPYSVFIVVFCINFIQMFFGWWLIRRYVTFEWNTLIQKTYLPTILITIMSCIIPYIIVFNMTEGLLRFLIVIISIEFPLFFLTYFIAIEKEDRIKINNLIYNKIKKNDKVNHSKR